MRLSPRDRRTLLVGGVCIAATFVFGKGVPAVRRWQLAQMKSASEVHAELVSLEQTLRSRTWLRDSSAARTRRLSDENTHLVTATTPDAAAATLAAVAEKIASDQAVDVLSVTVRSDSTKRAGLARVGVRLSCESDVEGLFNFLLAIETNEKPFVVRELSVAQTEPAAPTSRVEALRFEIAIETLARVDARKPNVATKQAGYDRVAR